MLQAKDTQIHWEVEGALAVLGWRRQDSGAYQLLGRLDEDQDGAHGGATGPLATGLTLWVGHAVDDPTCKVVAIRLSLRGRTSKGKNTKDFYIVLPVTNTQLATNNHLGLRSSVPHVGLSFALAAAPYAIMPVPRRTMQKPLDDSPGYLVTCMRSLVVVQHVDVHVVKSSTTSRVFQALADAAPQGILLRDLAIDVATPDADGTTRAINCWQHYPVAADDWSNKTHGWNPYVDRDPPAYSDILIPPSPGRSEPVAQSSPDEVITWRCVDPTPKKRKASDSPPRRRELLRKVLLDERSTADTDAACTEEVYRWAAAATSVAALAQTQDGRRTDGATNSVGTADACGDQDSPHLGHGSFESFSRPDMSAPSTGPLTSIWRTELTQANAFFFDLVALLQRALRCNPRAHEEYLAGFLDLGLAARLAIHELTPGATGTMVTTPAQDQMRDHFTALRDSLAQRIIADEIAKPAGAGWTCDPAPWPLDPAKQADYMRLWLNRNLQANADVDMFEDLIQLGRAAVRLAQHDRPFCVFPNGDGDAVACEYEFARARCLAAAFYKMGGCTAVEGRLAPISPARAPG
ncbi:uncharacterized protein J3D65DRAFT_311283 [Phyllosticta citribraziliensis]|uniref:Uncharacterized protein n=1 Tax=Phyllosticta citribraziliensis TaxID=989973 RepID=A0ABR1L708_9PEZI